MIVSLVHSASSAIHLRRGKGLAFYHITDQVELRSRESRSHVVLLGIGY